MSRKVDFYLIPGTTFSDVGDFCLRLIEKAFSSGHQVHLHCNAPHETEYLNRFLWESKPESFLPHIMLPEAEQQAKDTPITLSHLTWNPVDPHHLDLLVCYSTNLPQEAFSFARTLVIVTAQDDQLNAARALYRDLKASNSDVNIHDLRR